MKVRMKVDVSGGRNGVAWPRRGGTVDLPKDEALQMCRNGMAEPVDSSDDDVETATVPDDSNKRGLTTETAPGVVPNSDDTTPASEKPAEPQPKRRGPAKKTAAAPTKE
jgi:hypothetical protein